MDVKTFTVSHALQWSSYRKIKILGGNPTNCLLTSNSYCLLDCICLTLISGWVIMGGSPPPTNWGVEAPLGPPVPTPMCSTELGMWEQDTELEKVL